MTRAVARQSLQNGSEVGDEAIVSKFSDLQSRRPGLQRMKRHARQIEQRRIACEQHRPMHVHAVGGITTRHTRPTFSLPRLAV